MIKHLVFLFILYSLPFLSPKWAASQADDIGNLLFTFKCIRETKIEINNKKKRETKIEINNKKSKC